MLLLLLLRPLRVPMSTTLVPCVAGVMYVAFVWRRCCPACPTLVLDGSLSLTYTLVGLYRGGVLEIPPLSSHTFILRFVVCGAGSAGMGVVQWLCKAMEKHGAPADEAAGKKAYHVTNIHQLCVQPIVIHLCKRANIAAVAPGKSLIFALEQKRTRSTEPELNPLEPPTFPLPSSFRTLLDPGRGWAYHRRTGLERRGGDPAVREAGGRGRAGGWG